METKLLNHYKLPSLDPTEWPDDKNDEDSSDEEIVKIGTQRRTSKARYSALNRNATLRSSVPGAERSKDGKESYVQKDEPDPLGGQQSVIQVLRMRGLPIEDDGKLRNRFLLSSTTFSPSMFLSEVHNRASTDDLLRGLDFLSQSIEKKSASLKVLVESNFERFVRAKSTIDNVYKEMREHGAEPERPKSPGSHSRGHSRTLSRNSVHFRRTSGNQPFSPSLTVDTKMNGARKNALIKESEYGVQPIKTPLLELSAKAEEVWGPALGGREKEESLKAVLACVEKNRPLFELGGSVRDAIKRRDHEALVEDYRSAREYADRAKNIVDKAVSKQAPLNDAEVQQVIVTARMWADVDEQIDNFKRDVWRKLAGTHFSKQTSDNEIERKQEEHMELISILLELGVEDNPINIWLMSRYDFLKNKIEGIFERMKVEVEIMRRRLGNGEKPTKKQVASYLRSATADGKLTKTDGIDSPRVLEVWEHILHMLNMILSTNGGVLGEVIEFWETAQGFIDGRTQRTLPIGIDGSSRQHHRLSTDGVKHLTGGALELITKIRDELKSFFSEPPPDDLSLLLSPLPPDSPLTPNPNALSPVMNKLDASNLPPPSPRRGESWEKFGFWPPHATSISGSYYLGRFLGLIGTGLSEIATLSVIKSSRANMDECKKTLGEIRERCLAATLAAWTDDSENCRYLEDWTRSVDRHDLTNMPNRFRCFMGFLLYQLQQMLYVSGAEVRGGSSRGGEVIVPPSQKLLMGVRSQFVTSVYRALRGMVENAEDNLDEDDGWNGGDAEGLAVRDVGEEMVGDGVSAHLDSSNKNIRHLITLSNVQNLRNDIVPHLISQFETNFSVQITDEAKSIQDALAKIDTDLFRAYTAPITKTLDNTITEGITSKSWLPISADAKPEDARPYVYKTLLQLVLVHTEVSTTASPLTAPILKTLLESISLSLITAFKTRNSYNLAALRQATLDVEFLAQTMNNYTTDKASETQNAIYVGLDERTDNESRVRLQGELGEMRGALKRLREKTRVEFGCFKRDREGRRGTVRER